jgi:hypothetical protein
VKFPQNPAKKCGIFAKKGKVWARGSCHLQGNPTTSLLIMTKTTKNLLILSIVCLTSGMAFVTGIINVQNVVALYVALPAGAIFFGLFMIFKMLEKEASFYDEEHQGSSKAPTTARKTEEERSCGARDVAAVRHREVIGRISR